MKYRTVLKNIRLPTAGTGCLENRGGTSMKKDSVWTIIKKYGKKSVFSAMWSVP